MAEQITENIGEILGLAVAAARRRAFIGVFMPARPARMVRIARPLRPLRAGRVNLAIVVAGPFGRVGKNVIGRRDRLEPLLRRLIAGVQVRMILLRQLAIGRADLLRGGAFADAQGFVKICRHATGLRAAKGFLELALCPATGTR